MRDLHTGLEVLDLIWDAVEAIVNLAEFPPLALIAILIGVCVWLGRKTRLAEAVR